MIILETRPFQLDNTAICIGKFDGLHIGHQLLIESIKSYTNLKKVLFTFQFSDATSIYNESEKRELARELGIDIYISCSFDEELSHMEPQQFINEILIHECGAKAISVGEDFRFGFQRKGDTNLLKKLACEYKYDVNVFQKKTIYEEAVSSTRIRKALTEGDIKLVNTLLGRNYSIKGEVIHGNQIGRTLGMPTVNQKISDDKISPRYGVYASKVLINHKEYAGVTNIGVKPTISGESKAGVETYILDFSEDIYGRQISVELLDFLREEKKFDNLELLKKQMEADQKEAEKLVLPLLKK